MRSRPLKSANGDRFNTRTACLSRFQILLIPAGNSSTATSLKVSRHFQCWVSFQKFRGYKYEKHKYALKHFRTSTKSASHLEAGPLLQEPLQISQSEKSCLNSQVILCPQFCSCTQVSLHSIASAKWCFISRHIVTQWPEFSSLLSKVLLCNGEIKGTKIKSCYIL